MQQRPQTDRSLKLTTSRQETLHIENLSKTILNPCQQAPSTKTPATKRLHYNPAGGGGDACAFTINIVFTNDAVFVCSNFEKHRPLCFQSFFVFLAPARPPQSDANLMYWIHLTYLMYFIYFFHLMHWIYLIDLITHSNNNNTRGCTRSMRPLCVVLHRRRRRLWLCVIRSIK